MDIVRIDDTVLDHAMTFGLELDETERPAGLLEADVVLVRGVETELDLIDPRPAKIKIGHVEWHLCARAGIQQEVRELQRDGQPIFADVDTSIYCYKLVCPRCGRARYAKRNSLHQILYCRVCTRQGRLRNRALVQFRERERKGVRKRVPPHQQDQAIALKNAGCSIAEIGRRLSITPSGASKLLKRKKKAL